MLYYYYYYYYRQLEFVTISRISVGPQNGIRGYTG